MKIEKVMDVYSISRIFLIMLILLFIPNEFNLPIWFWFPIIFVEICLLISALYCIKEVYKDKI